MQNTTQKILKAFIIIIINAGIFIKISKRYSQYPFSGLPLSLQQCHTIIAVSIISIKPAAPD